MAYSDLRSTPWGVWFVVSGSPVAALVRFTHISLRPEAHSQVEGISGAVCLKESEFAYALTIFHEKERDGSVQYKFI